MADGEAAAAHFPGARHIVIANSFHVNALPRASRRSDCGETLARRFMTELDVGDERCAAEIPPLRLVPLFARHLRDLAPAHAVPGNDGTVEALRLVSAALFTSADVITRARENGAGPGVGLRGGTFTTASEGRGYRLTLHEVRWTEDLTVSGRIDWPGRSGVVWAELEVRSLQASGQLELSWPEGADDVLASVRGTLGNKRIAAEAPPP
jgi:hypothetical protein